MSGHHVTVILEPANGSGRCLFLQESHLLTAMHIVWNKTMSALKNVNVSHYNSVI